MLTFDMVSMAVVTILSSTQQETRKVPSVVGYLSVLASLLLGGTGTPESGALLEIVLPKEPVLWALGAEVVGRTTSNALLGLDAVV